MLENQKNRVSDSASAGLSETRNSGRTLGCLGVSIVAHMAFLAAMAILPQNLRDLGGSQPTPKGGDISMIDSADPALGGTPTKADDTAMQATAGAPVEVSVMTDETSDVALAAKPEETAKPVVVETVKPEPAKAIEKKATAEKTRKKPVSKPAAKNATNTAVVQTDTSSAEQAPTLTEESSDVTVSAEASKETTTEASASREDDPAPVLLANPPSDEADDQVRDETSSHVTVETVAEKKKVEEKTEEKASPAPVVAAVETKREAVQEKPSEQPAKSDGAATSSVASSSSSSREESRGETRSESQAERQGQATGNENGEGSNSNEAGGTPAAVAAMGPIRDASELRALPGNPNPVYPARDRLTRKQGTTVILGRVSPDGRVTELKLERSSGSSQMDAASMQAFRNWRFQAGQQGWVRKPFQFRLVGDAKEVPAPLGKTMTR